MAKQVKENKEISTKRIKEIIAYDTYVERSLCNVNTIHKLSINKIGTQVALRTMKEIRTELDGFNIDIKEICCNRVFGDDTELTGTELFIVDVCDYTYLNYRNDYLKMLEQRELEKVFPLVERKSRVLELEAEIKREILKGVTVGKINKDLRKSCEIRAEELRKELYSIEETFNVVEEEYLNSMLYLIAESKINEIKSRLEEKINYLEDTMEEIA